jgi:hypothetical protein
MLRQCFQLRRNRSPQWEWCVVHTLASPWPQERTQTRTCACGRPHSVARSVGRTGMGDFFCSVGRSRGSKAGVVSATRQRAPSSWTRCTSDNRPARRRACWSESEHRAPLVWSAQKAESRQTRSPVVPRSRRRRLAISSDDLGTSRPRLSAQRCRSAAKRQQGMLARAAGRPTAGLRFVSCICLLGGPSGRISTGAL